MTKNQQIEFKFTFVLCCFLFLGLACTQNYEDSANTYYGAGEWTLVYKNSHDGEALYGSKEELIYALRAGSPLRIGYGGHRQGDTTRSIEHIVDAQFISIANSEEVFAQIPTMIGQDPDLNKKPLTMAFHEDRKFSMIACTNGTTRSLSIDFKIDSLKTTNTSQRGFYWYVQKANLQDGDSGNNDSKLVEPLWKNPRKR